MSYLSSGRIPLAFNRSGAGSRESISSIAKPIASSRRSLKGGPSSAMPTGRSPSVNPMVGRALRKCRRCGPLGSR